MCNTASVALKLKAGSYPCTHLVLYVLDLPWWRPLYPQWCNTAAPQPVSRELLWGMLQATRKSVWGGPGRRKWRWGLAWPWVSPPVWSSTEPPSCPCAKAQHWRSLYAPHLFLLPLIWFNSLHLDFLCPHAELETAFPADDRLLHLFFLTFKPKRPNNDLTCFGIYWFNRKHSSSQRGVPAPQKQWTESFSSHRLSSCEEQEPLIAHPWACISMKIRRLVNNAGWCF